MHRGNGAENEVIALHIFLCEIIIAYHWPGLAIRIHTYIGTYLTAMIDTINRIRITNIHCAFPSTREHEV